MSISCVAGNGAASGPKHPVVTPRYLTIPACSRFLAPVVLTLPAQLLACHLSVARGIDPDSPRNLSKTLTVGEAALRRHGNNCQHALFSQVSFDLAKQPCRFEIDSEDW